MKRRENGEGTIYRRKDKLVEIKITVPNRQPDEPIRKSFYGRTKEEAKKNRDAFLQERTERARQAALPYQIKTVAELLDQWYPVMKKANMQPSYRDLAESLIEKHIKPRLGDVPLAELNQLVVQRFYNQLAVEGNLRKANTGLSGSTIKQIHNVLRQSLAWAYDLELIGKEFYKKLRIPASEPKEKKAMSLEDALKFLHACKKHPCGPAYILALLYGLRRGELLGLRWDKVDLKHDVLQIHHSLSRTRSSGLRLGPTKTKNGYRDLPLIKLAKAVLMDAKSSLEQMRADKGSDYNKAGYVFITISGNPHDPKNFVRDYQRFLGKLGIEKICFHELRHTSNSILEYFGVSMRSRMKILGQGDYRTNMKYTHVLPGTLRADLEVMDRFFASEAETATGAGLEKETAEPTVVKLS